MRFVHVSATFKRYFNFLVMIHFNECKVMHDNVILLIHRFKCHPIAKQKNICYMTNDILCLAQIVSIA